MALLENTFFSEVFGNLKCLAALWFGTCRFHKCGNWQWKMCDGSRTGYSSVKINISTVEDLSRKLKFRVSFNLTIQINSHARTKSY